MANIADCEYRIFGDDDKIKKLLDVLEKGKANIKEYLLVDLLEDLGVDTSNISVRGSINFYTWITHDNPSDEYYVYIAADCKWDWQPDFVKALKDLGYTVQFNCEEPGMRLYVTNSYFYGKYKILTYEEEEYAKDDKEACELVSMYLRDFLDKNAPTFNSLDECKEYLKEWNERDLVKKLDKWIEIIEFELEKDI